MTNAVITMLVYNYSRMKTLIAQYKFCGNSTLLLSCPSMFPSREESHERDVSQCEHQQTSARQSVTHPADHHPQTSKTIAWVGGWLVCVCVFFVSEIVFSCSKYMCISVVVPFSVYCLCQTVCSVYNYKRLYFALS